jgi:hypothetical protein
MKGKAYLMNMLSKWMTSDGKAQPPLRMELEDPPRPRPGPMDYFEAVIFGLLFLLFIVMEIGFFVAAFGIIVGSGEPKQDTIDWLDASMSVLCFFWLVVALSAFTAPTQKGSLAAVAFVVVHVVIAVVARVRLAKRRGGSSALICRKVPSDAISEKQ